MGEASKPAIFPLRVGNSARYCLRSFCRIQSPGTSGKHGIRRPQIGRACGLIRRSLSGDRGAPHSSRVRRSVCQEFVRKHCQVNAGSRVADSWAAEVSIGGISEDKLHAVSQLLRGLLTGSLRHIPQPL